jgi:5'-nucleotidase
MRKKIGIDLDSTLNNLEQVWLDRYNQDYDDNLTVADMTDWDVTTYVKPECGVDMYKYLWEPGFFRNLGAQPFAIEVCEFLHEHFDIYIVTSAHPNVVADKWAWIEEHLPFLRYNRFIPLHEKNLIQMDYLIDDGPHNIEAFKNGTPILMDMPYNQYLSDEYVRCKGWKDVMHYFVGEIMRLNQVA